jgi:hypothetical protein
MRAAYRARYADHIGAQEKTERIRASQEKAKTENMAFKQHIKTVQTTDLAWAAGLWEAEGNAEMRRHSKYITEKGEERIYYEPRLRLFNNDKPLLERFQLMMGVGTIIKDKITAAGNPAFAYCIYGDVAIRVGRVLWPYLISKYRRKQMMKMLGEEPLLSNNVYMREKEKLAWVAGIHEGEGCAGKYHIDRRWREVVNITNTQHDILENIKNVIGFGTIAFHRSTNGIGKTRFQYSISCKQARTFATVILPFVYSTYKRGQLSKILG